MLKGDVTMVAHKSQLQVLCGCQECSQEKHSEDGKILDCSNPQQAMQSSCTSTSPVVVSLSLRLHSGESNYPPCLMNGTGNQETEKSQRASSVLPVISISWES
jgi:hypothetical protein